MGSSGGGKSGMDKYYQDQQLAIQREQLALSNRQHEESMAIQREALDKPVAAVAKNVALATQQMVGDQQAERATLRGIRSTYSQFARRRADDDGSGTGGKTRLGD